MKRILLLLVVVITLSLNSFAQVPEGFKYQAVLRDAGNLTLNNQSVGLQLTIIQDSVTGTAIYTETFARITNAYGLVNLEIGSGTTVDTFTSIDWSNGTYFIETSADLTGGTSYEVMGASQLMSVPYALYAKTSGGGPAGAVGPQGPAGNNGTNGIAGPAGAQGLPGNNGINGGTGPIGPQGIPGANGANGITGPTGLPGNDGLTGPIGPIGNDGPAGLDGTNAASYWTESAGNVHRATGFVGIGTANPTAPLHVVTQSLVSGYPNFSYYDLMQNSGIGSCCAGVVNDVSIHSAGRVMASQFNAFSDARIKNVLGISNSNEDLSTLLAIEVTDYTMKDKAKDHKPYKKVIAQQVESVYSQAVSAITDVVPDIYAVSVIKDGFVSLETDLQKGDKVKLIFDEGAEMATVVSTNAKGFKVDLQKTGNVFVYGREVNDFRTVDYEAISMLNVSATQELYKLILKQQKTIENQKTEISAQKEISEGMQSEFDARIKALEEMFNMSTLNK
jgi:hypothetical protein